MLMDFREKEKYHEVHPAKLAVDISTTLLSIYLYWVQDFVLGTVIGYLPSVIVTVVIIKWVNLEKIKQSPLGRYIDKYMTNTIRIIRIAGLIVATIAAWYNIWWLVLVGLLVILLAWLRGKILPMKNTRQTIDAAKLV